MIDLTQLVGACQVECMRCRKSIGKGTPKTFWINRLRASIQTLSIARAVLVVALRELGEDHPDE